MKVTSRLTFGLVALVGALLYLGGPAGAAPRYTVTCSPQSLTPPVGSQNRIDCTIIDQFNAPVTDAQLTFFVASDPSGQASFGGQKSLIVAVDPQGRASVNVQLGSRPGTVGVEVTYTGLKGSFVVMQVGASGGASTSLTTSPTGTTGTSATTATTTTTTQSTTGTTTLAPSTTTAAQQAATSLTAPRPVTAPAPSAATTIVRPPNTGDAGLLSRGCSLGC